MSRYIRTWQVRLEAHNGANTIFKKKRGLLWDPADAMREEIAELRAALAATPPQPAPQPSDLHDAIMRTQCDVEKCSSKDWVIAYKEGHRDARHAAAELVAASEAGNPASVQQDRQDAERVEFLQPADMAALRRFAECSEDSESGGYDVPREVMSRLSEIGVARHLGFGNYMTTAFGDYVLNRWSGEVLPLATIQERNVLAAQKESKP